MSLHVVDKMKNFKEKIVNFLLNYRMIALTVVVGIVLSFSADLLTKLYSVYSLLANADQHYAQEIADEYYVLLLETEDLDEAVELRERMVKLSMDGLQYDLNKPGGDLLLMYHRLKEKGTVPKSSSHASQTLLDGKNPMHPGMNDQFAISYKTETEIQKRNSTAIGVGISPDHVFYCRSDHTKGVWIVGLDLQQGQGEALEMTGRLAEINKTVSAIREDKSDLAIPLHKGVEELSALINKENRIRYFDAVKYKKIYNVPLLPN